jgi:hypothetical protein
LRGQNCNLEEQEVNYEGVILDFLFYFIFFQTWKRGKKKNIKGGSIFTVPKNQRRKKLKEEDVGMISNMEAAYLATKCTPTFAHLGDFEVFLLYIRYNRLMSVPIRKKDLVR